MVPLMRGLSAGKGLVGISQLDAPKISLKLSIAVNLSKGF